MGPDKQDTLVLSELNDGSGEYVVTQKQFTSYGGYQRSEYDSICQGEVYLWGGEELVEAGEYRSEEQSVGGLDSISTLHLFVHPNPAAFVFSGESAAIKDQHILYIAPVNPDVEYSWSVVNGSMVSDIPNDTMEVVWESAGEGELTAWALNIQGCSSDTTSLQVLIGTNGVGDLSTSEVVLYPVPVREVLHVQCDLDFLEIGVVDLSGREVAATHGTSIDLSHLTTGTYVVRLKDRDGTLIGTRKIVKE